MGKIAFTAKQNELIRTFKQDKLKRLNILEGSVRSGKTWISLILWAVWVASRPKDYPNIMCAKSLQTLKRNCLSPLQELVGKNNFKFSLNTKEGVLFGRKILLEGANDGRSEGKIRGSTLGGAYCDELTLFPKDFFIMLTGRQESPNAKRLGGERSVLNKERKMNVLKSLKSFVKGFKKGGENMDSIADLSKIESASSPLMREKTREWWSIFQGSLPQSATHKNFRPLPVAYTSTAYLAQLVTGEIKYELADERLKAYAQKNLLPNLDRIVQLALVGGYTVIKPYITRSGEMFFDVGTSRDFLPIAFDENGHVTEGIFFERIRYKGKIYERCEHHRFDGKAHYVHNSAYLYGTRQRVELTEIPRWEMLLPEGAIPSNIPMIATFRTPYANNIDLDSELPISLFANSVDTLHEIDAAHSEYRAEFKKMSAKVFADETVIHGKSGIPDDYFVTVDGNNTSAMEQQIMTYAPQIREEAHKAAINTELRLYEVQIGISCGTFTFDSAKGLVTATQVLSEDRTTYNTVAQLQRQLRPVLEAVAEITANLARFYGFDVTDGEPAIEFGDSVFEDTGTEFSRRFQMVQAGLLKPEEFNAWYFGVPLEKAREMLPEMTTLFGGDE